MNDTEFTVNDVLVEILDKTSYRYIIKEIDENGCWIVYLAPSGRLYLTSFWCSFGEMSRNYVKVGFWDDENNRVIEDD